MTLYWPNISFEQNSERTSICCCFCLLDHTVGHVCSGWFMKNRFWLFCCLPIKRIKHELRQSIHGSIQCKSCVTFLTISTYCCSCFNLTQLRQNVHQVPWRKLQAEWARNEESSRKWEGQVGCFKGVCTCVTYSNP